MEGKPHPHALVGTNEQNWCEVQSAAPPLHSKQQLHLHINHSFILCIQLQLTLPDSFLLQITALISFYKFALRLSDIIRKLDEHVDYLRMCSVNGSCSYCSRENDLIIPLGMLMKLNDYLVFVVKNIKFSECGVVSVSDLLVMIQCFFTLFCMGQYRLAVSGQPGVALENTEV